MRTSKNGGILNCDGKIDSDDIANCNIQSLNIRRGSDITSNVGSSNSNNNGNKKLRQY